jgi:hypothetical protein
MAKKAPKPARAFTRVKWDASTREWYVSIVRPGAETATDITWYPTKHKAIAAARPIARAVWEDEFIPTQLYIHNMNGRIGKGGNAEASYGCDSKSPG